MIDIVEDLKTYLKTITAVTDLVAAGTAARIYTHESKQGVALPYVILEVFEGSSEEHLNDISGIASNRIQVDAYGATSSAALTLAEAIRLAPLQMYRGLFGTTFITDVTSNGGYRRGRDQPTTGGNQRRYWVSRDYIFRYHEPITA